MLTVTPQEILTEIIAHPGRVRAVDVRAEIEFAEGALPTFFSAPILNTEERHEVGLCYKQSGQAAAVELGHKLLESTKAARVSGWRDHLVSAQTPVVACWRGGMRSAIACEWLAQTGLDAHRVIGGYKALRRELLSSLEQVPEFLVVGGPTGSGKTLLLNDLHVPQIDLEKLANHRGSAFGKNLLTPQPTQATFENHLAFEIRKQPGQRLMVEDESLLIGKVHLPLLMKEKMNLAPMVRINMAIEERVTLLLEEYVQKPLSVGLTNDTLLAHYEQSVQRIRSKLGGLAESEVLKDLRHAFQQIELEPHRHWIRGLLLNYYDKAYGRAYEKNPRQIAFEGSWEECKQWIQEQYA